MSNFCEIFLRFLFGLFGWGELERDPGVPDGKVPSEFQAAFFHAEDPVGERLLTRLFPKELEKNTFCWFRKTQETMADNCMDGLQPCCLHAGHDAPRLRVVIIIKGIRRTSAGRPLLEVLFSSPVEASRNARNYGDTQKLMGPYRGVTDLPNGFDFQIIPIEPPVAMVFKEVFEANAARLAPEYKQHCKRKMLSPHHIKMLTLPDGQILQPRAGSPPPFVHGAKRFRAMIQLGHVFVEGSDDTMEDTLGGHPHRIFTEDRSLDFQVGHDQPGFYEIFRVALWLSSMPEAAVTAPCFWCKRVSETTLRIYLTGAQGPSVSLTDLGDGGLDPSSLPRWGELKTKPNRACGEPPSELQAAFFYAERSFGELLMNQLYEKELEENTFYNFRKTHGAISDHLVDERLRTICLQSGNGTPTLLRVMLIVKGIRRTHTGRPLLEVVFGCTVGSRKARGLGGMQRQMQAEEGGAGLPGVLLDVSPQQTMLMKQVLEANAARSFCSMYLDIIIF
ncbi:hypothetical protein WJX73_010779 [Symbiochloris irregularis]|uniref:Uncharacterized protein n=1 Tax=Symbiochloris irregularis TaxID=706552 RepID=A0AAW1PF92_9CHLO